MKRSTMILVALALVGSAQAGIVEDFESYDFGTFQGQSSSWSTTSADWKIVDYWGQKALKMEGGDNFLYYADQQMDASGDGYTMMWMQFSASPYGNYSGTFLDLGDGSSTFPPDVTFRRRFYPNGTGTLETTYNPTVTGNGAYSMTWNTDTWWRLRREGTAIQIWSSFAPITADNPGTLMLESANPGGLYGGWCGLYGVNTTYFDDVVIMEGDYIPEPATMSLLGIGGVVLLYRRRGSA